MAEKLFNLLPSDIGRRLSDFRANLSIDNLDNLIREVIDTLTTRESKVQDNQGRWYSLRIRDRKSTRLNSSHITISYAGLCLTKNRISFVLLREELVLAVALMRIRSVGLYVDEVVCRVRRRLLEFHHRLCPRARPPSSLVGLV